MPTSDFPGAGGLFETPGALSLWPGEAAALLWAALAGACQQRASPWRTPVMATVSAQGLAEARILVLRAANSECRCLELHTDLRSAKLRAVAANRDVELCFWHPGAQLQLRASGKAGVAADSARRESAWARVPAESRRNYAAESAPGTALPGESANRVADGFAHFAIIDVEVSRLEWLWLGGAEHHRGRLTWADESWLTERLVP